MQVLNNKYRKEMKKVYDVAEPIGSQEFDEDFLGNRVYGALSDGTHWLFVGYEHSAKGVKLRVLH